METQQARLMTGLAVLLVVISAALYLGEDAPEPADPDATEPVWAVAADQIVAVRAVSADKVLAVQKDGDTWKVTEPDAFPADPGRVQGLLRALAEIEDGVPIDGGDPAEFGLADPPAWQVSVTLADGKTATLALGVASPVGWRSYARAPSGKIVAVNGHPGDELAKPANQLRDMRVATFGPETVRRVTLSGPEGTLSVHGEATRWWMDGFTRADPDAVDDLVTGIVTLRFDQLVEAPTTVQPVRTVRVETTAGPWTLYVGAPGPEGALVEIDGGATGVVMPEALAFLGMGPTDLGDSRVFPFHPERTKQIAVVRGDKRYAITDGPEGWLHDGQTGPQAEQLGKLVNDAGIRYRREPVPPITEPWLTVVLTEDAGERKIELGQVVDGDFRVARDADGGEPYLAPIAEISALASFVE